jgi:hypothetical protein
MKVERLPEITERRKRIAQLLRSLRSLRQRNLSREQILLDFGAAAGTAGDVVQFVKIVLPPDGQGVQKVRFVVDKSQLQAARAFH